jgi:hypothetical protein
MYLFIAVLIGCSSSNVEEDLGSTPKIRSEIDTAIIDANVERYRLRTDEKIWARLPWISSYDEAMQEAKKRNRPIFFFSMYGELDGRC